MARHKKKVQIYMHRNEPLYACKTCGNQLPSGAYYVTGATGIREGSCRTCRGGVIMEVIVADRKNMTPEEKRIDDVLRNFKFEVDPDEQISERAGEHSQHDSLDGGCGQHDSGGVDLLRRHQRLPRHEGLSRH